MKKIKTKIRKNVFETNSSSTHSLQIYEHDKFLEWKKGKYLYDSGNRKFVKNDDESIEEYVDMVISLHKGGWCPTRDHIKKCLVTYEQFYAITYGVDLKECKSPDGKWIAVSCYEEDRW